MSVRKRNSKYFEPRRSSRDRTARYSSLDENILGIRTKSELFHQISEQVENPHHYNLYNNHHPRLRSGGDRHDNYDPTIYVTSSSGRGDRRKRATVMKAGEEEEEEEDGVADDDEEEDDDNILDENVVDENVPNQQRTLRRMTRRSNNRFLVSNGSPTEVLPNHGDYGSSGRMASKLSEAFDDTGAVASDDRATGNDNDDGYELSMYERVKSRRQSHCNSGVLNGAVVERVAKRIGRPPGSGKRRIDYEDDGGEMVTEDDKRDDNEEEEEEESQDVPRQYQLREKRAQVTRFEYRRELPRRACSHYNATANGALATSGYALGGRSKLNHHRRGGGGGVGRRRRCRRRLERSSSSTGSSSTSTDDSDNGVKTLKSDLKDAARFERRKLRSLQKGRSNMMPSNLNEKDLSSSLAVRQKLRELGGGSSCADIDPMEMDRNVGFGDIGGLTQHIQSLKEVVVFPLLYPELFERFDVSPPKGVLFYGPPGTGKTLVARALANECSRGERKVAFFMRKGADCLSKWVGESERQLRLLFDQAFAMRPSIIFFDEIDGLAPVRSSRQDQIHSSIVSTLLALMDGLDKRGEIIVIGATNRLDSIDPALRRPGRFDREMRFDLPDASARHSILDIHTKSWAECRPHAETMRWLAETTSGYCGADLKALCTEAVLIALRECFPHIYLSADKLQIDLARVKVTRRHFEDALRQIVPAARRDFSVISHQLNTRTRCFVEPVIEKIMTQQVAEGYVRRRNVDNLWNTDLERVVMALKVPPSVPAGRLLLHGRGTLGQTTHFLPVLVNRLDHLPVFSLSCEQLFAGGGHVEENVAQVVRGALRATGEGAAVVLLMPDLDVLEFTLPPHAWKMLMSSLNAFSGFTSALLIASVQHHYDECSEDLRHAFRRQNAFEITPPTEAQRMVYFRQIFEAATAEPFVFNVDEYPEPPKMVSSAPVRKVSSAELKELQALYDQMLRQFRIYLRELLGRLIRDRRFSAFNLPVDKEDAEDYYDIIKNPICLSEMMLKIDTQCYESKAAFLADIELIKFNALEYNPAHNMEGKVIRHNAIALVDMAEALFEMDFDDDFTRKLEETKKLLDEARCAVEQTSKNNKCGDEGDRQQDLDPTENCAGAANKPNGCGESGDQSVMMSPPTDQTINGNGGCGMAQSRKRFSMSGTYNFSAKRGRREKDAARIVKKYSKLRSSQKGDDSGKEEEEKCDDKTTAQDENHNSRVEVDNGGGRVMTRRQHSFTHSSDCSRTPSSTTMTTRRRSNDHVTTVEAASSRSGGIATPPSSGRKMSLGGNVSCSSENNGKEGEERRAMAGTPLRFDVSASASNKSGLNESSGGSGHRRKNKITVNLSELESTLNTVVRRTAGWSVPDIECLAAALTQHMERYRNEWCRDALTRELRAIADTFRL